MPADRALVASSHASQSSYHVAIVGAGPVGSLCALAHARKGARVALLEANLKASTRLAGEWLHPPAVRALREAGIHLEDRPDSSTGQGFVVFPEDGAKPIVLSYAKGTSGLTLDHASLVAALRRAVEHETHIDFMCAARVRGIENGRVTYSRQGAIRHLKAARIVGADGRASVVRQSLGLGTNRLMSSRMVGVLLEGVSLPFAGYGHVLLGAPGPILMYGLGAQGVRVLADVPLARWRPRERAALLADSYAPLLPPTIRTAFMHALQTNRVVIAGNEIRPRVSYGDASHVLIGDAAGHYHPLTAVGLTLGFGDALALAENEDFSAFVRARERATLAPERLALGLYEVFADQRAESLALRRAVYGRWRSSGAARNRTMAMLACEDTSTGKLGMTFASLVARAAVRQIPRTLQQASRRRARQTVKALAIRSAWFLRGIREHGHADKADGDTEMAMRDALARALLTSMPPPDRAANGDAAQARSPDLDGGLERASAHLLGLQGTDGAWEGELVWCPMLTAQYVLVHHIVERPIDRQRRARLLHYFAQARVQGGLWGFHERSPPHLFVTTLVYVAARLLGTKAEDPLIAPARAFIRKEGVISIPSWGKFWLALMNLYDWRGLNPILPELVRLPRRLPLHPCNWYCHSRLIYMAMAFICPQRFSAPVNATIKDLRDELFPQGIEKTDFAASRNRVRQADLFVPPTIWLRFAYRLMRLFERFHGKDLRDRSMAAILKQIDWELEGTSHASLSPLNGLLNIVAVWLRDASDKRLPEMMRQLERWVWEDEKSGARVVLQRTPTWDTGFALQALETVRELADVRNAMRKGADYLIGEQVGPGIKEFRQAFRTDPHGGWCLGRRWQGWPVSDCTAEAALGVIAGHREGADTAALKEAIYFMLRAQNRDGGFGSYEARRTRVNIEWLNPSEMFADAMTEDSYVECTASCLAALAACRPTVARGTEPEISDAIARGESWLRQAQASDGSWRGAWGVNLIYGTMFGVRGLVAAGRKADDPALALACSWLLDHQHDDGGWGEHHSGCLAGRYVAHPQSQIIQTAWALIALLEAGGSNWRAITSGIGFLLDLQDADGGWPKQDPAGVYARSGILDYPLYRKYFPLHALGLYAARRRARRQGAELSNAKH